MNIAVLISGNGSNLQALLDSDVRSHIKLVVSNREDAYGLERATKAACPTQVHLRKTFETRGEFDESLASLLRERQIDLVVLAGWMHILGERYLLNAPGKTINLHPALPGQYPGLNAIERAWDDKAAVTGCMVHEVILEVDAGEVLGVAEVSVLGHPSLDSLASAMHRAEHTLLVSVVKNLVHMASII